MTAWIRARFLRHRPVVLSVAALLMGASAVAKLGVEYGRLMASPRGLAALDLAFRHEEVQRWFRGLPVYTLDRLTYPPQAYAVIWPLLGWLDFDSAVWLWVLFSAGAIIAMSALVVREAGAQGTLERLAVAFMWLSMNALGLAVGLGQFGVFVLPAVLGSLMLAGRDTGGWVEDLSAAALLQIALVKPTLTAPLLLTALATSHRLRPWILAAVGYVALTLFALSFQSGSPLTMLALWFDQIHTHPSAAIGYGDIQTGLALLGMTWLWAPAAIVFLGALGWWVLAHRDADRWILIGVAALAARFWTYHRVYDDVLIIFPMVALFRLAKAGPRDEGLDVKAGLLLVVTGAVMMMPGRLYFGDSLERGFFVSVHVAAWLAVAAFLTASATSCTTRSTARPT